jgi:class 3 adenylate cyclase/tetratricopeptide (TPR) repeat protein
MSSDLTATFVFTDLVGSTAMSQRLGPDAAEHVRHDHFSVLRGAISASGGVEVKNLGDGLMVVYTSSSRALAGAVAMQQAIDRHNRRAAEPLEVRMGMGAGEVTEEDQDYFGDAVVEAARLCAMAEGGQVLATDTVRVLAGRSSGHELRAIGDLELKGIAAPVTTLELVWEPAGREGEAVPVPARLLRATTDSLFGFCGRTEARALLADACKRSQADEVVELVLVSGEAGIGKSTLVAHAARDAHDAGATVLFGHCDEDFGAPYQPWVEALTEHLEQDPQPLEALPAAQRAAIGRLLPALGIEVRAANRDADTERLVLMDAVVRLLESAGEVAPLVLVLDDLHWADQASLHLLRRVATAGAAAPVTVIGTYRDTDLSSGDALTALLADLHREPNVARVPLDGLGDVDIAELMATAAGHELDDDGIDLAHTLRRETAGNPFFTAELLRHLGESGAIVQNDEGRWTLERDLAELGLPSSVRDVVGRRVERLGPEAVRLLSLAAVIGRDFDVEVLEAVAASDGDALLDIIDGAVRATVITETDQPERYRFVHALTQHSLYADLSPLRRQRAHERVAETLEASTSTDPARRLSELAHHWLAATKPADSAKALRYAEEAADAALASLAPEDAAHWYRCALDLAAQNEEDDLRRARLLVGLGTAQFLSGGNHQAALIEGGEIADRRGHTDLLVAAVLGGSSEMTMRDPEPELGALAHRALDAVGPEDTARRAELFAALATFAGGTDFAARRTYVRQAISAARAAGDDETTVRVANLAPLAQLPFDETVAVYDEGVAAAERTGEARLRSRAMQVGVQLSLAQGDITEARRINAEMMVLVAETGRARDLHLALAEAGLLLLLAGDLVGAEERAEEMLRVGTAIGLPEVLGQYGGQLFEVRRHQGRLGEIAGFYIEAAEENHNMPVLMSAVATLLEELGRPDEARRALDQMLADGAASGPGDATRVTWLGHCAEVAARLGAVEHAATLRALIEPYAGQVIAPGSICTGAVARYIGLLDHLRGDLAGAEAHLRQALAVHEAIEAPYFIALTQLDLADVLAERAGPAAADEAGRLVERARQGATSFGYEGVLRRAGPRPEHDHQKERPVALPTTDEMLAKVPLFATLSKEDRRRVSGLATRLDIGPDRQLMQQGGVGHELVLVLDGEVDVVIDGVTAHTLGPGDWVGEIALLERRPRTATVVSRTPAVIDVISQSEFADLVEAHPQIEEALRAQAADRLAENESPGSGTATAP